MSFLGAGAMSTLLPFTHSSISLSFHPWNPKAHCWIPVWDPLAMGLSEDLTSRVLCQHIFWRACQVAWSLQPYVAPQAPLSMGFSRQEYWSGLPGPLPGDLPDPGIEPVSLRSPALTGRFFAASVKPLAGPASEDPGRGRGTCSHDIWSRNSESSSV